MTLRGKISTIPDTKYRDLFLLALASILEGVCNVKKDGKGHRYKKGWEKQEISEADVFSSFLKQCDVIESDISFLEDKRFEVNNSKFCRKGDVKRRLKKVEKSSVDLIFTSPPYLNSFDYSEVYKIELWSLGFVNNYSELSKLRSKTIRSHVQSKWPDTKYRHPYIEDIVSNIKNKDELWNKCIPNMIKGYFNDMIFVFNELYRILKPGGKVRLVVGNSAYSGVVIPTDELLCIIAKNIGFNVEEIRIARYLNFSAQQKKISGKSKKLRESILFIEKPD